MKRFFIAFLVFGCWGLQSAHALAPPCIAGLPCVTELTEEDFNTPEIEPNKPSSPNSPKNGESNTCDADLMNQIYAKAYLEAERQNMTAEATIRKPDSVLAYSCFDQMASLAATKAAGIFSESTQWDGKRVPITASERIERTGEINTLNIDNTRPVEINTVMNPDRMDQAIENYIFDSLESYLIGQYPHSFVGQEMPLGIAIPFNISSGGYNCAFMAQVHQWTKCDNFQNAHDGFYDFETLTSLNIRQLPTACEAIPELMNKDIIDVVSNEGFQYSSFQKQDENFFDRIDAGQCGEPHPTGLMVTIEDVRFNEKGDRIPGASIAPFEEHFCTNPGCYYKDGTCAAQ